MRKILANDKGMVVYLASTQEYWLVTISRGMFQISCLNTVSEEYGHNEVRATFVSQFGEPTFERKPGNCS